jgi:hypothetical protein
MSASRRVPNLTSFNCQPMIRPSSLRSLALASQITERSTCVICQKGSLEVVSAGSASLPTRYRLSSSGINSVSRRWGQICS